MDGIFVMPIPKDLRGNDPNDFREDPGYAQTIDRQMKEAWAENEPGHKLGAFTASSLHNQPVPAREWVHQSWLAASTVTGLSGPPGVAKSLYAQQMDTHIVAGVPLLGEPVMQSPALHVSCEDDADELHRRQVNICTAIGVSLGSLNDLHLMSWVGEETQLVVHDNGLFHRTERFHLLDQYIGDHGIRCVTLDLVPDFWNGNEIVRTQVNAFVKAHLGYLAQRHNAAIVPLFHPSKAGLNDGTGTSGSTAWEGSFRGRIYLSRVQGDDLKSNDRIISRPKANYAALDELELEWRDGYLWEKNAGRDKEDEARRYRVSAFLECLEWCETNGRTVSPSYNSQHYYGRTFPEIWKQLDGRHKQLHKKSWEKAYLECVFDGVILETERTGTERSRIKFVGYKP